MTALVLHDAVATIVRELRAAWATGRRVALSLDGFGGRIEGHVERVAASDASVVVAGETLPLERVLALHRPSRLGDSTAAAGERFDARGRAPRAPQHETLWNGRP